MEMQGGFMIRHSRLTALGIMLCLLAALFSVEAKIAWFSPTGATRAQIRYDKATPAEPTKALLQRSTVPAPPVHDYAGTTALIVAALLPLMAAFPVTRLVPVHPQASISRIFSSALFFRPPPFA
jgi:hypothetical protein